MRIICSDKTNLFVLRVLRLRLNIADFQQSMAINMEIFVASRLSIQ